MKNIFFSSSSFLKTIINHCTDSDDGDDDEMEYSLFFSSEKKFLECHQEFLLVSKNDNWFIQMMIDYLIVIKSFDSVMLIYPCLCWNSCVKKHLYPRIFWVFYLLFIIFSLLSSLSSSCSDSNRILNFETTIMMMQWWKIMFTILIINMV